MTGVLLHIVHIGIHQQHTRVCRLVRHFSGLDHHPSRFRRQIPEQINASLKAGEHHLGRLLCSLGKFPFAVRLRQPQPLFYIQPDPVPAHLLKVRPEAIGEADDFRHIFRRCRSTFHQPGQCQQFLTVHLKKQPEHRLVPGLLDHQQHTPDVVQMTPLVRFDHPHAVRTPLHPAFVIVLEVVTACRCDQHRRQRDAPPGEACNFLRRDALRRQFCRDQSVDQFICDHRPPPYCR